MSGWKLDPPSILAVVASTEKTRDRLSRAVRPQDLERIDEGIAWGGPLTQPLRDALVALTEVQGEDITTIRNHVAAGILGLTNAATAYRQGNDDMVAELQSQMLATADNGDFTYFIRNGMTG